MSLGRYRSLYWGGFYACIGTVHLCNLTTRNVFTPTRLFVEKPPNRKNSTRTSKSVTFFLMQFQNIILAYTCICRFLGVYYTVLTYSIVSTEKKFLNTCAEPMNVNLEPPWKSVLPEQNSYFLLIHTSIYQISKVVYISIYTLKIFIPVNI